MAIDIFFYLLHILERLKLGANINQYFDKYSSKLQEIISLSKRLLGTEKYLLDMQNLDAVKELNLKYCVSEIKELLDHHKITNKEQFINNYLNEINDNCNLILSDIA